MTTFNGRDLNWLRRIEVEEGIIYDNGDQWAVAFPHPPRPTDAQERIDYILQGVEKLMAGCETEEDAARINWRAAFERTIRVLRDGVPGRER